VFGKTSGFPQFILITAGSPDEPSRFKPSMDFFTASAQPWDHMNPDLPKFLNSRRAERTSSEPAREPIGSWKPNWLIATSLLAGINQ
jgi:hypothetical protein